MQIILPAGQPAKVIIFWTKQCTTNCGNKNWTILSHSNRKYSIKNFKYFVYMKKKLSYAARYMRVTGGRRLVIASIPQFQKNGAVPNRALTVGIPRTSWALLTSGRFLKIKTFFRHLYMTFSQNLCDMSVLISSLTELTTDKHLSFQCPFQSQCWAFHYMVLVWSFLLIWIAQCCCYMSSIEDGMSIIKYWKVRNQLPLL